MLTRAPVVFAALLVASSADARDAGTPALRDGEGFVVSGGVKIWYRVEGGASPGLPILLIHGGPGETARLLERTIGPLLAVSRPVVYTDYRGAGRSQRPTDPRQYSFEQLADDQEALRRKLGLSGWAVFGHSNGAATAITYALRFPKTTRALVLCTPLLSPRDLEVNMVHKVARALPDRREKLRANLLSAEPLGARFMAMFKLLEPNWHHRLMFYSPENGALLDAMQAQLAGELGNKPLMAPQLMEGLEASGFFAFDAFPQATRLTMPTLVLVGRTDSEVSNDNSETFSATVPAGRFVAIERSGHFPYIEDPAATTLAMEDFLEPLDP